MTDERPAFVIERKWVVFSAVAGTLWFAFTIAIVLLLQIDQDLALTVAIVGSVLAGVAVVGYFLFVYRN